MKNILVILAAVLSLGSVAKAGSLDAMLGYSFADEFDIDSGDREAETAFNLGIRYKDAASRGFGWNVGMSLETIRDFENSSSELGFFLLEGNATLAIDQIKALYIFAGLNYPMIIYKHKNLSDVDPVFGVQFGTGLTLTKQAGVELAYRTANFEFGTQDANLWGFLIRGYYTFAGF